MCCVLVFFFFQAEDGIRDLVRSRGLGDVYKRQPLNGYHVVAVEAQRPLGRLGRVELAQRAGSRVAPVSYTHLTLPTSDLV